MVGTFGMVANVRPWVDNTFALGTTDTLPISDRFSDFGFDTQYQYHGENWWLTLSGTYIHENQKLDATFGTGGAANPTNTLDTTKLKASLVLGDDNRISLTGQYSSVSGTADSVLYAGNASTFSPNSSSWMGEIAYIPFGSSKSPIWPWANARIGLQYTAWEKYQGTTVGASGHNTVFLYAWVAM